MSGSTNQGVSIMLTQPLEVRTPRGATKIAPPQAISGMIPRFLLDHYLMYGRLSPLPWIRQRILLL